MDLLDRLHRRLVEAIAAVGIAYPPTIADIYQRLVPYRAVRGELGVHELAEYEFALIRLLAGERDYAEVDSPVARDEFRAELASPYPIVGIYRDYAGVMVRLAAIPSGVDARSVERPRSSADDDETIEYPVGENPIVLAPSMPGPGPARNDAVPTHRPERPGNTIPEIAVEPDLDIEGERADDRGGSADPFVSADRVSPAVRKDGAGPEDPRGLGAAGATGTKDARDTGDTLAPTSSDSLPYLEEPRACFACRTPIPDIPAARFCPNCGADQTADCGECGAPLSSEWRFCVRCGSARQRVTAS